MDKDSWMALAHRRLAQKGGRARAKSLTGEERVNIARMGGRTGGRGRRKEDRLPPEVAEKIRKLIDRTAGAALWYMSDSMKRPRFRGPARQVLRAIACEGSLDDYKSAHQLLKCLSTGFTTPKRKSGPRSQGT
ncbi:hypothetical protein HY522_07750 [bacterium]|nr:hypothetical protein [bacterium]